MGLCIVKGLGSGLLAVTLAGCVGDAPATGSDAAPDQGAIDAGNDVAVDTTLVCGGGTQACGSVCVDVAKDGAHCGRCGHDCGGGTCVAGVCQPVVVVDSLDHPAFDVDATQVYFGKGANLLACPKSGCTVSPAQIATLGNGVYSFGAYGGVYVGTSNVAFMGEQLPGKAALFVCSTAGCPVSIPVLQSAGLQSPPSHVTHLGEDFYWSYYKQIGHAACTGPNTCTTETLVNLAVNTDSLVAVDANNAFFSTPPTYTPGNALVRASKSGPSQTPTVVWPGPLSASFTALAAYGGQLYVVNTGQSGNPNGSILTCATSGCAQLTKFIDQRAFPTLIAVDASGVYWFDSEQPNVGDAAAILTCPLSGCVGGPKVLATKQTGTGVLHVDDKFVYWATATQISRVAKP